MLASLRSRLENLIFLTRDTCYICRESYGRDYICSSCYEKFQLLPKDHMERDIAGARVFSVSFYNRFIRDNIIDFKYAGRSYLHKPLARLMAEGLGRLDLGEIDLVTAVPLDRKRQALRGYNQSELLGLDLAKRLGLKTDFNIVKKTRPSRPQSQLGPLERKKNLTGAFRLVDGPSLRGKKILVVDDVVTTGATIKEIVKTFGIEDSVELFFLTLTSTKI